MTESDLITRAISGDAAAEREIFQRHIRRIYQLAFRMTGDSALSEDCAQETFVRAFRNLHGFRGDAALATWLQRIAVTVTLNCLRSEKRFRERAVPVSAGELPRGMEREARPFLRARIGRAVDTLPEDARLVLVLYDIEGYSHKEIAAMLSIGEGVSKTRLSRARARLRVLLADLVQEITP